MTMEAECTICLNNFNKTDDLVSTNCGHVFHNQCLTNWLSRSEMCPECRQNAKKSSVHKIFITFAVKNQTDTLQKTIDELKSKLKLKEQEFTEETSNNKKKVELLTKDISELNDKVISLNKQLTDQDAKLINSEEQRKIIEDKLGESEKAKLGLHTTISVLKFTVDEKEKIIAKIRLQCPEEKMASVTESIILTDSL